MNNFLNIYQEKSDGSQLRYFGVCLFIHKKWNDKNKLRDTQNAPQNRTSHERNTNQTPFLYDDEIEELWAKTKDNLDLFRGVFNDCQIFTSLDMLDPRERDEDCENDRCFHCHSNNNPCRQPDGNVFPEWVDDASAKSQEA